MTRFIDLAHDGGCSKKAPALQLRALLDAVGSVQGGALMNDVSKEFPDCGVYDIGGQSILSTVDVVLPMTIKPRDFGKIATLHVLSDLYACGGAAKFALCIFGIPAGMSAAAPEAVEALSGAMEALSSEGAVLIGGHTLVDQSDFFLGFAAIGEALPGRTLHKRRAQIGDHLILTKPLGTGIAIGRWKFDSGSELDHDDILNGMMKSNKIAAQYLIGKTVNACTDITGYGFFGHLFNILVASNVSCNIYKSKIPVYRSALQHEVPGSSRQAGHNIEYVIPHLTMKERLSPLYEALLFDSEVSGGLLICVPEESSDEILRGLIKEGVAANLVGEICQGEGGRINLLD